MFMAGKSVPKIGEIRFGYVAESEAKTSVHKYIGIHPYLIVSNNIYNKKSGQCEVIPFTTKRTASRNPVHVDYKAGEVEGLKKDSTLVVEGRDTIRNLQLSEPIGIFTEANWAKAVNAMMIQCPLLNVVAQTTIPKAIA